MVRPKISELEIEAKILFENEYIFGGNRQEALVRDKFQCQKCGLNQMQHIVLYGKQLCVHHIDNKGSMVKRGKRNNDLSNLITLCCSCHGKLHSINNKKSKKDKNGN